MDTAILAAFLADIKARPVDPTPRLILADWIEEHSDSDADHGRAALLRLSTQDLLGTAAYNSPIAQQCRSLFNQHRLAWIGLAASAAGIRVLLVAGLLQVEATVSGWHSRALRLFAESPNWLWVEGLTIKGQDQRFPRVWGRPWLQTIARLRLDCGAVFLRRHWPTILNSPHLGAVRVLNLESRQLEDPADLALLAAWPGLARVESLNLSRTPMLPEAIATLTASPYLTGLRTLSLGRCAIGEAGARSVFRCPGLAGVEELALETNNIPGAALAELASAPMAKLLRRLALSSNALGDAGMQALAAAPLPALRYLDVAADQFDVPGATALVAASWLGNLAALNASTNTLGPAGPALLSAPLVNLTALILPRTQLNADAADALCRTPHLRRLRSLMLGGNPELGDTIVAALIGQRDLPELQRLDLSRCGLGDVAALALASWAHLPALTHLDLSGNRLTDTGVRALVESPHYHPGIDWRLSANSVTLALRREYSQRKPPLHV